MDSIPPRTLPAVASRGSSRTRRASLALATAAATLLTGGVVVGLAPAAQASGSDNAAFLSHLNSLRAAHGLHTLALASDLTSIATQHSGAMMARQTIFHNASLTSEVRNWQVLGENVGMGGSASAIDTAFDHSPEHYANEVNAAYTQVGIGTARDNRGYLYVTLDFRKPMGSPAPAPAPRPVAKAPVVHAPAVHVPVARPPAATSPASSPRKTVAPQPAAAPRVAVPAAAKSPATAAVPAATPPVAAATVARQAPTVVPATATGGDPVAAALAFSRFLAGLR